MTDPILHIWQQTGHHDDAYIYGNRDGLKALKSLIEAALAGEPTDGADLYQNDGEGYSIVIRSVSDAWVKLLPSAYTEFPDDNEDRQKAFIEVASGVAYQPAPKSLTQQLRESVLAPDGWKLVPIRPTKAMIALGALHAQRDDDQEPYRAQGAVIAAYADMLANAPEYQEEVK